MTITRFAKHVDDKAARLRSALGLSGASDRELLELSSLFDEVDVGPGEVLMREGAPGRELFLIVDGEVAVSLDEQALATIGAGEFVGEMTLFERAPRSATVTTLTRVRAFVAGAPSFATLLNNPVVLRKLGSSLAGRLRAMQGSPNEWRVAGSIQP
jgi:CRP-like cAMP-binding protein